MVSALGGPQRHTVMPGLQNGREWEVFCAQVLQRQTQPEPRRVAGADISLPA